VLLVDRDRFPSDTVSTHMFYPNTLARFQQLGVLDRLLADHEVPFLEFRVTAFGHETAGGFTPIEGFDRGMGPRRLALDKAIVDTALAAGAAGRFGDRVVDLIGTGTDDDPVGGVVFENGDEIRSKWVFGADGRGSSVAGKLGIEKERLQQGELSFLFGYWSGLENEGVATLDIRMDEMVNRWAVEDGLHILTAAGGPEFTRGSHDERMRRYLETLRRFPGRVTPAELDRAEMVSDLVVAPESLMRGFFRKPSGPGWALLGDAAHFKHPGTAQGIGDAVEQAIYIAESLSGSDPGLDGYGDWIDRRAAEHYDWSFAWGRFPRARSEALFRGWATEQDAGQDLRDSFSRRVEPSQVMSPERVERWRAGASAANA
jgi:2-polyprenyl-6-methoxyphenol hydroxylase-like FAD-dependent oxidoreductase